MNEENALEFVELMSKYIYEMSDAYSAWRKSQRVARLERESRYFLPPRVTHGVREPVMDYMGLMGAPEKPPPEVPAPPKPPMVGVGLRPDARGNSFKIAIRAWRASDLDNDTVAQGIDSLPANELDIRVVGKIKASTAAPSTPHALRQRTRPLHVGLSIGHHLTTAGTLGAFVETHDGELCILSCNHVLALANKAVVGDAITQPGSQDGGTPNDRIGALHSFVKLKRLRNRADAALATVDPDADPRDYGIPLVGRVRGHWLRRKIPLMDVTKVGRTTGLTHGVMSVIGARGLPVEVDGVICRFDNVIEVLPTGLQHFSWAGDSGAIVVDPDRYAVGLLFAKGPNGLTTYLNHFHDVVRALPFKLIR